MWEGIGFFPLTITQLISGVFEHSVLHIQETYGLYGPYETPHFPIVYTTQNIQVEEYIHVVVIWEISFTLSITRRMFGIDTAQAEHAKSCEITFFPQKGQRSQKVTTHFCPRAFRLKT